MHFNKRFFLRLIRDLAARSHTRPIEDSQVVKLAFGFQQFALAQRLFRSKIGADAYQVKLGAVLAEIQDLTDPYLLIFSDLIGDINFMAIVGMA